MIQDRVLNIVFEEGSDIARAYGLAQYSYGQILRIQGLHLPTAVEIHFSAEETGGISEPRIGVTRDGITEVPIPDSLLANDDTESNYYIWAWVYIADENSGQTIKKMRLSVEARSKPVVTPKPEDADLFREAIQAVNDAAERAEDAYIGAEQTESDMQTWVAGKQTEITGIKDEAVSARNTAIQNANISINKSEETEADKLSTEANKTAVEAMKQATDANVKQSAWYVQEQAAMLARVPMMYAVIDLDELHAIPNAKEGDFGIVQEPNMMLFRYITHNSAGEEIQPAWVWMTDLNIHFNRESLLRILQLPEVATSGKYGDLLEIPNRYNTPVILDSSGEVVAWNYADGDTAVVTLTEPKALNITGAYNGCVAVIQCYGSTLDFSNTSLYQKSATVDFLEPLEAEHITYTLIYNAGKWDVSALVYEGSEPDVETNPA